MRLSAFAVCLYNTTMTCEVIIGDNMSAVMLEQLTQRGFVTRRAGLCGDKGTVVVRQRYGYGGAEVRLSEGQRLTGWLSGQSGLRVSCYYCCTIVPNAETFVLGLYPYSDPDSHHYHPLNIKS